MADGAGSSYGEQRKDLHPRARVKRPEADLFVEAFKDLGGVPAPIGVRRPSAEKGSSPLPPKKEDPVSSKPAPEPTASKRERPLTESKKASPPASESVSRVASVEDVGLSDDDFELDDEPVPAASSIENSKPAIHKRIDDLEKQLAALHRGQGDMHAHLSGKLDAIRTKLSLPENRPLQDNKLADLPDLDFNPDGDGMDVPILSFVKPPVPVKKETAALRGSLAPETIAPKNGRMRMLPSRKQETKVLGAEVAPALDNEESSDRRLVARYQEEQRQKAQERAEGIATYAARAAEYKKQLEDVAGRLAEKGEFVELPFQPSSPPIEDARRLKSSWISSIGSGLKDGFKNLASALSTPRGEKTRAELMREYELALERYETAEQTKVAIEKNLPVFRRSMQGTPSGVGSLEPAMSGSREDSRRLNEQIAFEKKLQKLERAEELARDLPTMLLSGRLFDGRRGVRGERQRMLEEFTRVLNEAGPSEGEADSEYARATQRRRHELPAVAVFALLNSGESLRRVEDLGLPPEAAVIIDDLTGLMKERLEILHAKAHASGVEKDEREEARRSLRDMRKLVGGKTVDEMTQRAKQTLIAILNTSIVAINPVTQWRLAEIYKERVRDVATTLGMDKGGSASQLQKLMGIADTEMAEAMKRLPEEPTTSSSPAQNEGVVKQVTPKMVERDQRATQKIEPPKKTGWRRFLPW